MSARSRLSRLEWRRQTRGRRSHRTAWPRPRGHGSGRQRQRGRDTGCGDPRPASAVTAGSSRRTSTASSSPRSTLASPSNRADRFNWFASSRVVAIWIVPFRSYSTSCPLSSVTLARKSLYMPRLRRPERQQCLVVPFDIGSQDARRGPCGAAAWDTAVQDAHTRTARGQLVRDGTADHARAGDGDVHTASLVRELDS
jgi:hypothetical protein